MRARNTVKYYSSHEEVASDLRRTRRSILRKMPDHYQPADMARTVKDVFYTLFPTRRIHEMVVQKDFSNAPIYRVFSAPVDGKVAEVVAHVVAPQDLHVSFFYNMLAVNKRHEEGLLFGISGT